MKKKYIITFLFLLFFNINTIKAQNESVNDASGSSENGKYEYYFEKSEFSSETDFTLFYSNVCIPAGSNQANCQVVCENGAKGSTEIDGTPNICGGIPNVKKFKIKEGTFEQTKYVLNITNCKGSEKCWEYVSSNYCSKYKNKSKNSDYYKLCNKIKNEVENSTGGETKTCSFVFKTRDKSKSMSFGISISTDEKRINIVPNEDVDGTTVKFNETSWAGHGDKIYFYEKESNFEKFSTDYLKVYKEKKKCPEISYCLDKRKSDSDGVYNVWYTTMNGETECSKEKYMCLDIQTSQNGINKGTIELESNSDLIGDKIDFLDCKSLFEGEDSEKLLDLLHTMVTLVKISIPLLLFGLGTLDFAKAIFAGSEDNMKKAQSKFIMRVMVAICIFLIPTLIKLILTIASGIWGNISPDFCGIL